MPQYIKFTPTYTPITLDEYLKVPTAIVASRQKEVDKIDALQNEADKWRALMGDSDEAKAIWAPYDTILNDLGDNMLANKTGVLDKKGRELRSAYNAIKYRAEDANARREADIKKLESDAALIGSAEPFINYYNNPDYKAHYINGKSLMADVVNIIDGANEAKGVYRNKALDYGPNQAYSTGLSEMEARTAVQEAFDYTHPSDNLSSDLARKLRDSLDRINYSQLSDPLKTQVYDTVLNTALGSRNTKTAYIDTLAEASKRASIASAYSSLNNPKSEGKWQVDNNPFIPWSTGDNANKRYIQRTKTTASGTQIQWAEVNDRGERTSNWFDAPQWRQIDANGNNTYENLNINGHSNKVNTPKTDGDTLNPGVYVYGDDEYKVAPVTPQQLESGEWTAVGIDDTVDLSDEKFTGDFTQEKAFRGISTAQNRLKQSDYKGKIYYKFKKKKNKKVSGIEIVYKIEGSSQGSTSYNGNSELTVDSDVS